MRVATVCRQIGLSLLGFLTAWGLCSYLFEGPASLTLQSLLHFLPGAVAGLVAVLFIPKRKRRNERTLTPPKYRGD